MKRSCLVAGLITNRSLWQRIGFEKDWLFFFYQIYRLFYQRNLKQEDQDFRRSIA